MYFIVQYQHMYCLSKVFSSQYRSLSSCKFNAFRQAEMSASDLENTSIRRNRVLYKTKKNLKSNKHSLTGENHQLTQTRNAKTPTDIPHSRNMPLEWTDHVARL